MDDIVKHTWTDGLAEHFRAENEHDVDAILRRVTERTRIVFLANPNNPTGTYVPFTEIRRLQAALPPKALLVIDAAYAELAVRTLHSIYGLDAD